jgi:hypothetical protein
MSQFSGSTPEAAAARLEAGISVLQAQADAAISSQCGVAPTDLAHFYAWAKENQKGQLRDAIQAQVNGNSFAGYRALANRYLAENPPSIAALEAGGYEVRQNSDQPEVMIDGRWMTLRTAARLGII